MSSQRVKMTVGIFVAGGLSIALAAAIWLGMSRFLQKGEYYVSYFDESVQGLSKDSPVKYRGVSIGRVHSIDVAPDYRLVEVMLMIESEQKMEDDMVSQLRYVGITGSMFVEIDRRRPEEPNRTPTLNFPIEYPVIASRPSEIGEMLRGLDDVISRFRDFDVAGVSERIKETLDGAGRLMDDADARGVSDGLKDMIASLKELADKQRLDNLLASIERAADTLDRTLGDAGESLGRLDNLADRLDRLVQESESPLHRSLVTLADAADGAGRLMENLNHLAGDAGDSISTLSRQLTVTAQNLENATDNLNRLMELIADHPSQLLFGEPPPPRFPASGR